MQRREREIDAEKQNGAEDGRKTMFLKVNET
jgi:hypothetical protein